MMNDPLLNQPWGPPTDEPVAMSAPTGRSAHPAGTARTSRPVNVKRSKHPAASSRILAVGFSVAAVIGMSAAYTKAQRQQPAEPNILDSASQPQLDLGGQSASPANTVAPAINEQPRQHIVQVPVPQASPAIGGYAPRNQAPTQQQSSGSH